MLRRRYEQCRLSLSVYEQLIKILDKGTLSVLNWASYLIYIVTKKVIGI